MQKAAVPDGHWHESIEELPARPLLLAANEFLDALPVRQLVDGVERKIFVAAGGLRFDRDGDIVEHSPARDEAVRRIAQRLVDDGGMALFIDYGHERSAPGDTLQAVRGHGFAPVLDRPGEQDLTSHVDFEAVGNSAGEAGAAVTPLVRQSDWLRRLGIDARADALARSNPDRAGDVHSALERLTAPDQMGSLFKVLAVHAPDWPAPAGFE
jgi:NADH dehydrogenase [ubiquinone] 1 alpha subcomplex assembly factor 7